MFGQKNNSATPMPLAEPEARLRAPTAGKGALTIIAQGCVIEGAVRSEGDIQVDGAIVGDVSCVTLNVGQSGQVRGDVTAETATVRGSVTGGISARLVQLTATAKVEGDVAHAQLVIEAGAQFEGRSSRANGAAPPALPAPEAAG
jgi:cytoskeletal protein CcmA (bactofilin family)